MMDYILELEALRLSLAFSIAETLEEIDELKHVTESYVNAR